MEPSDLNVDNTDSNPLKSEFWKELVKLLVIAIVVVIPFRLYIAQPFIVDGASMDPTFKTGNYLIVDEISYRFKTPERGSVMVFNYPLDPKKQYIKRVIGLPGETVMINKGQVTIVNKEHPQGQKLVEPYVIAKKEDTQSLTLKEGEYFVMGDNRAGSADSRIWGPVPKENIIGRPFLQFLPPAVFPGDSSHFENNPSTPLEVNNQNE